MVPLRLLAGLTLALIIALSGCGGTNGPALDLPDPAAAADAALTAGATTGETSTADPAVTTGPKVGVTVNQYLLDRDDCFNRVEQLSSGRKLITTTRIPCDAPHKAQIFDLLSYPGDASTPYPGADIIEDYALASCYQSFASWAGIAYELSILAIRVIVPTKENYESQYRRIHCYIERQDGADLLGSTAGRGI